MTTPEMNSLIEDAKEYLARGWSVIPAHYIESASGGIKECSCRAQLKCPSPGKHPSIRWQVYAKRRPSMAEVEEWWYRHPKANIAICTGEVSGLVVIDIDPRHGGEEMWAGIEEAYGVTPTLTAITASGGRHLYYRYPGRYVKGLTNVGGSGDAEEVTGVDIRADGNIVIAPPSRSYRERTEGGFDPVEYEWEDEEVEIAPMPQFVWRLIEEAESRSGDPRTTHKSGMNFQAVLDREKRVPEGMRNDMMTAIAGHYFGKEHLGEAEIENLCQGINRMQFDPPLPEIEVGKIVQSVAKMQRSKRRAQEVNELELEAYAERVEQMEPPQLIEQASDLWEKANVPAVTDWYMLRSQEGNEYFLVTPEAEVSLGDDLLSYAGVRKALFNDLGIKFPSDKAFRQEWEERAWKLRKAAREQVLEPIEAGALLNQKVDSYVAHRLPRANVPMEERRDALALGPLLIRTRDGSGSMRLHIRVKHFAQWLTYEDAYISDRDLQKLMRRSGWQSTAVTVGARGQTMRTMKDPDPFLGEFVDDGASDDDSQDSDSDEREA